MNVSLRHIYFPWSEAYSIFLNILERELERASH